jgi:hypothetical protein
MILDEGIGKTCLLTIASIWQVDDSAIKWVDGGFDWAPGSHLVRVRALSKDTAEDRWRISVETDFLASIPIEDEKFIELTASLSSVAPTYSMQYPPVVGPRRFALEAADRAAFGRVCFPGSEAKEIAIQHGDGNGSAPNEN